MSKQTELQKRILAEYQKQEQHGNHKPLNIFPMLMYINMIHEQEKSPITYLNKGYSFVKNFENKVHEMESYIYNQYLDFLKYFDNYE